MIDETIFIAFLLVFIRIFAFTVVAPVFFPQGTPQIVKVMFSGIMAFILLSAVDYSYVGEISGSFQLIAYSLSEFTTGLTFGFIVSLCFYCIRAGGSILDMQVGFAMMSMFDPSAQGNVTLIERLLYWLSLMAFFLVNGHHILIKTFVESFNIINLGQFILSQESAMLLVDIFIRFFELGIRIAIPIMLIIILTDLTLGLVAKAVPQLNIMILGLPVKILLGLGALSLILPMIYDVLITAFDNIPNAIRQLYKIIPLVMIFSSDDKTEEATPHKMSEARKKGQIARSKEVNTAITLIASTIILITLGEFMVNSFKEDIIEFFTGYLNLEINMDTLQSIIVIVLLRFAMVALPMIIPIMIMGVAANFLQTGFIHTTESLKPQFSKINPISGFKRMFSIRSLVELIKQIVVIVVVGYVEFGFLKDNFRKILTMGNMEFSSIITTLIDLSSDVFMKIALVMTAIALIDFLFQKFQFKKDMRMTKQEVKEEFKQMEGDPQVKGKIKQRQREMATRRMMQSVPDATVVITNPTHIAVALKYEEGKSSAPLLVAKGSGHVAIKIKELAKENNVPIIENKPLARLIFNEVDLEKEIPSEMYQAVAEILALVYKLKRQK